ncbi:DUF397 domain-containing protein [Streptomyces formicae]
MKNRPTLDEIAAVGGWFRSSYSAADNECVEITSSPRGWVAVRDSKDTDSEIAITSACAWSVFVDGVQNGKL